MFSRRAVGIIVAAATISVAAACAPGSTAQPPNALDTQSKDVAQWTLPLDPYLLSDAQLTKAAYAEAIMIHECLADIGIDRPVPYVDIDAAYGSNVAVRSWFDLTIAQKHGYHDPSQERPAGLKAWDDFQLQAWTSAEDAAFLKCRDDPAADPPEYSNTLMNFTSGLAAAAFSGAGKDPDVLDAAARWHECMAGVGIEDLPRTPIEMPSDSLRQRFEVGASIDGPVTGPTAEEIDMATADADCRDSSGFTEAFYDALWTRETSLLLDNESALTDAGAEIDEITARIDEVIAESRAG
jgi:hypothetical protein